CFLSFSKRCYRNVGSNVFANCERTHAIEIFENIGSATIVNRVNGDITNKINYKGDGHHVMKKRKNLSANAKCYSTIGDVVKVAHSKGKTTMISNINILQ
ncbi:hypothetical protein Bhyg_17905, partial [Pseudolycoriella hygida]